jgi:hypothetical protein
MDVEIGAEAALFPEKEYINEIFVAVLSLPADIDQALSFPKRENKERLQ